MVPGPRWFLYICTGVSDGISECVTMSLMFHAHRGGATTIWRREGSGEGMDPLSEKAAGLKGPLFAPRATLSF